MPHILGFFLILLGSRFLKFENAKNYNEFALAQDWAAKSLVSLVETYGFEFENIFEIGCGSGLLSKVVASRLRFATLTLNDLYKSDIMDEFNAQIGDIMDLGIPKNLDLVISSSVFQWIDRLDVLSAKIASSLKANGLCAFSMLTSGSLYELSSFTHQSLDYKTSQQIERIFSADFDILAVRNSSFVSEFDSLKELLVSLKETGVNNLAGNFVLNKSSLEALEAHFARDYKLSYNYIFVVAQKREENEGENE